MIDPPIRTRPGMLVPICLDRRDGHTLCGHFASARPASPTVAETTCRQCLYLLTRPEAAPDALRRSAH